MTEPINTAAYLVSEKAYPLEVKEAPFPTPGENDIVIKTGAIAVNPVDCYLQERAMYPVTYPWILGFDVAGTIVAVGPSITTYKPGERICGLAPGFDIKDAGAAAFQAYVKLSPPLVTRIPDNVTDEEAAVLPLGMGTACAGLFEQEHLGLRYPSASARAEWEKKGEREREVVLVWGAASSVGSCAVQLAVNAGYEVFATASAGNIGYTRDTLGAARVFDYRKEGVVEEILTALKGRKFAGVFDAVGATEKCFEVAASVEDGGRRFVSSVMWLPEGMKVPEGVQMNWVWGSMSKKSPVGKAVFKEFLPGALEDRRFVPAPRAEVVGKGLENVQKAIDILKQGVSAKKVVVTL